MLSKNNRLTLWILAAMLLGIGVGYAMHTGMEVEARKGVADNLKILTDIFLRLVKMIIAPLVFSTLVVGIAKLGDMKTVGRVGGRSLLWFFTRLAGLPAAGHAAGERVEAGVRSAAHHEPR